MSILGCPDLFESVNNRYCFLYEGNFTSTSLESCLNESHNLVSIHSEADNSLVKGNLTCIHIVFVLLSLDAKKHVQSNNQIMYRNCNELRCAVHFFQETVKENIVAKKS